MKHQQVSVDFWAMAKCMFTYGILTILGWMMLRLFNAVFTFPRRLRNQQESIQATLQEFQRRYPGLNITEEDLRNAEKEMDEWDKEMDQKIKEDDEKEKQETAEAAASIETPAVEDKKSI